MGFLNYTNKIPNIEDQGKLRVTIRFANFDLTSKRRTLIERFHKFSKCLKMEMAQLTYLELYNVEAWSVGNGYQSLTSPLIVISHDVYNNSRFCFKRSYNNKEIFTSAIQIKVSISSKNNSLEFYLWKKLWAQFQSLLVNF